MNLPAVPGPPPALQSLVTHSLYGAPTVIFGALGRVGSTLKKQKPLEAALLRWEPLL